MNVIFTDILYEDDDFRGEFTDIFIPYDDADFLEDEDFTDWEELDDDDELI